MEKHSIQINGELYQDISLYCKANGLKINIFCENMLKQLLMSEKYGDIPFGSVKVNTINNNTKKEITIEDNGDLNLHTKIVEGLTVEIPKEEDIVKSFNEKILNGIKKAEEEMEVIVTKNEITEDIVNNIDKDLWGEDNHKNTNNEIIEDKKTEISPKLSVKPRKRRLK